MNTIFLKLLNLSIGAGWLVLAILCLRLVLKKAPKWVNCALWALVGLRLVFPVSIESVFSLIPSAQTVPPEIVYEDTPEIHSGIPFINSSVNPILSETLAPAEAGASINPLQVATEIASYIWLLGFALLLGYMAFGYIRLRVCLRTATRWESNVYQCEAVSPFVLGIFKPRIYLPYHMSEEDMTYVIAHEKAHLRRRDHLIKPIAFFLLAVYWFHPLMWVAYILLCRDVEYACDEKVLREFGGDIRREYSMSLLKCSVHRGMVLSCPLAFGEVGVKERVKNVMNYKKPAFWILIVAVVAVIVTAVCFLTNPKTDMESAPVLHSKYYEAVELCADIGSYSYVRDADATPYYYIDENMNLYEKEKVVVTGSGLALWNRLGTLVEKDVTKEEMQAWFEESFFFMDIDNIQKGDDGVLSADRLYEENESVWTLIKKGENGNTASQYLFLLQKDGSVYYGFGNNHEIRWLYRMDHQTYDFSGFKNAFFGYYDAKSVLGYTGSSYSIRVTTAMPYYRVDENMFFYRLEKTSGSEWEYLGRVSSVPMTKSEFCAYVPQNASISAESLWEDNEWIGKVEWTPFSDYQKCIILLKQKNGDIYFANVSEDGLLKTKSFSWIYQMTKGVNAFQRLTSKLVIDDEENVYMWNHSDGARLKLSLAEFDRDTGVCKLELSNYGSEDAYYGSEKRILKWENQMWISCDRYAGDAAQTFTSIQYTLKSEESVDIFFDLDSYALDTVGHYRFVVSGMSLPFDLIDVDND